MVFSVAPCNWNNLHFSTAPERMKVQRLQSEAFQFQQEDMYVSMFKLDFLQRQRRTINFLDTKNFANESLGK